MFVEPIELSIVIPPILLNIMMVTFYIFIGLFIIRFVPPFPYLTHQIIKNIHFTLHPEEYERRLKQMKKDLGLLSHNSSLKKSTKSIKN